VEYMDNQHGLVKQKLQPDSDSKVFHEQALEYSKAVLYHVHIHAV